MVVRRELWENGKNSKKISSKFKSNMTCLILVQNGTYLSCMKKAVRKGSTGSPLTYVHVQYVSCRTSPSRFQTTFSKRSTRLILIMRTILEIEYR